MARQRSFAEDLKLELQAARSEAEHKYEDEIFAKIKPYPQFNPVNPNFEDRRNEPWPWHPINKNEEYKGNYSLSPQSIQNIKRPWLDNPPPVTPMGQALGLDDIIRMQEFQKALGPPQAVPPGRGGMTTRAMPNIPDMPPAPPANILPPNIPGYGGPLPEISAEQFGPKPQFNMGLTLPTGVGDVTGQGSFTSPEEWKAMLRLRREF